MLNVEMFENLLELKKKLREIRRRQFVGLIINEDEGDRYLYLLWEENGEKEKIRESFDLIKDLNQRLTDIKKMLQKRIEDLRIYNENFSIKLAERIEKLEKKN
ncbi:MAG: hypothetical protein ACTSRI_02800 [Promethearchaeota archaeon]